MRPVNLIPREERRGGAPSRTGPLAYVLVGVLVAVLAGVTAVVLTGNTIAEREAEVARLEQAEEVARARAESLRAFAEFASLQQARVETVSSLAQSRFDWERVMRELALVMPADVWLINLTATVSPAVSMENQTEIELRGSVDGPALAMIGCAPGHVSVAQFVAALEDIDGVTRVGLSTSELPSASASDPSSASDPDESTESTDDCRVQDFISRFEIVVAFDEAQVGEGS